MTKMIMLNKLISKKTTQVLPNINYISHNIVIPSMWTVIGNTLLWLNFIILKAYKMVII